MKFNLSPEIGDGLANAAPLTVMIKDIDAEDDREHLLSYIFDERIR